MSAAYDTGMAAGVNASVSDNGSKTMDYINPFVQIMLMSSRADLTASYSAFISYEITDYDGNERNVMLHQPGIEISFYPCDIFAINGQYVYTAGEASFSSHLVDIGGMAVFKRLLAGCSFSAEVRDYDYNGSNRSKEFISRIYTDYDLTEKYSADISIVLKKTDYISYDEDYSSGEFRGGLDMSQSENIIVAAGLSTGIDSDGYYLVSGDVGMKVKFYDHMKLGFRYSGSYFIYSGSGVSDEEDDYFVHVLNLSLSLYF